MSNKQISEIPEKITPTMTVDIKGLDCPKPLAWAKSMLDILKPGDTLEVLATDPSAVDNFKAFGRVTGNKLVEWNEDEKGVTHLIVEKGA